MIVLKCFCRSKKIVPVIVKVCTLYLLGLIVQVYLVNVHYMYMYTIIVYSITNLLTNWLITRLKIRCLLHTFSVNKHYDLFTLSALISTVLFCFTMHFDSAIQIHILLFCFTMHFDSAIQIHILLFCFTMHFDSAIQMHILLFSLHIYMYICTGTA